MPVVPVVFAYCVYLDVQHWLDGKFFAVVFVLIAGIARHPRRARQEVRSTRVEHFEFERQLTEGAAPRLFAVRQCILDQGTSD